MGWFNFLFYECKKVFFIFGFEWLRNLYFKKLKEKKAVQNPSAFAPKGNLQWFKVLHLLFVLPFPTFIWIPFMAITSSTEKPPCHMLWKSKVTKKYIPWPSVCFLHLAWIQRCCFLSAFCELSGSIVISCISFIH